MHETILGPPGTRFGIASNRGYPRNALLVSPLRGKPRRRAATGLAGIGALKKEICRISRLCIRWRFGRGDTVLMRS